MTIWRGVDQLDFSEFGLFATAADDMMYKSRVPAGYILAPAAKERIKQATIDRAHWEAGYTAALANMPHNGRLLDQLRRNEAEIARLTAENASLHSAIDVANERHYDALAMGHEIATLTAEVERLTAQLEAAHTAIDAMTYGRAGAEFVAVADDDDGA